VLTFASLSCDPFADVAWAILQCDAIRFAALEKDDDILAYQSYVLQVQNDAASIRLRPDECFQVGNIFFIYSAAERKDYLPVR
jgi:hypothetical protein